MKRNKLEKLIYTLSEAELTFIINMTKNLLKFKREKLKSC